MVKKQAKAMLLTLMGIMPWMEEGIMRLIIKKTLWLLGSFMILAAIAWAADYHMTYGTWYTIDTLLKAIDSTGNGYITDESWYITFNSKLGALEEDASPKLGGDLNPNGHAITGYLPSIDEDDMSSNSDAYCPTQQSVVAYLGSYEPIINDNFDPDRIAGDTSDDDLIDGAVMGECNNSKGALPTTAGAEVGTVPTVQEGGTVAWAQPSQISITTTLGEEFDSEAELRALTPIMQTSSLEDAETLTPTTGYKIVQVALTCEDTNTTFSISETGAVDGELLMIRNASTGAYDGDNCLLAYSAGVVEHEGGAGTSLTIKDNNVDSVILQYQEDRWVVISNFSSTRYFGYINIPNPTIDDPDNWTLDGYGRWIANAAGSASLPAVTSGMNMVASVRGAYVAVIDPDGTEEIFLNGTTCGAGVSIQSEGDDDGERVSLSYSASGDWDATAYGWICTP